MLPGAVDEPSARCLSSLATTTTTRRNDRTYHEDTEMGGSGPGLGASTCLAFWPFVIGLKRSSNWVYPGYVVTNKDERLLEETGPEPKDLGRLAECDANSETEWDGRAWLLERVDSAGLGVTCHGFFFCPLPPLTSVPRLSASLPLARAAEDPTSGASFEKIEVGPRGPSAPRGGERGERTRDPRADGDGERNGRRGTRRCPAAASK
ncbi:hypothetical protein KM043_006678 [Ampulex compressa]|nr:hypothetical protein KM043_006678 [Ampulex compressa]